MERSNDPLTIIQGDALSSLRRLPDESVQCCVTSPPYWGLRDYGHDSQIGLEKTPEEYVARLVEIFRELKRVLRADGTLWLNLGDTYAHRYGSRGVTVKSKRIERGSGRWGGGNAPATGDLKPKDLVGIPWMVAFALRADGWYLRSDIIWSKPNPMPESVTDRPTKSHEYIFLLSKAERYYYNADAVREPASDESVARMDRADWRGKEGWSDAYFGNPPSGLTKRNGGNYKKRGHVRPHEGFQENWDQMTRAEQGMFGRNKRSVWNIATRPFPDAHFATFPTEIPRTAILAVTKPGDAVLDPFAGSGTTGKVAIELGRRAILIEPKAEYVEMIKRRCQTTLGLPITA